MSGTKRYDCELPVIAVGHGETSETTSMVKAEDYDALRAEVERLRGAINEWQSKWESEAARSGLLLGRLAERDALLHDCAGGMPPWETVLKIKALLSASAEPACPECHGKRRLKDPGNPEGNCTRCASAEQTAWQCEPCALEMADRRACDLCGAQPSAPLERDEQELFESVFPMPSSATKFKGGYAATEFNAWDAHRFCNRWDGWKARAALERKPA